MGLPESVGATILAARVVGRSERLSGDATWVQHPPRLYMALEEPAAHSARLTSRCGVRPQEKAKGNSALKHAGRRRNTSDVLHLRRRLSSTTQPRVLTVQYGALPRHVMPDHPRPCYAMPCHAHSCW
jgi:hypothetical protein